MIRYPLDRLHEEVAFLAVHLGWSHDSLMAMTHRERRRWLKQVSWMNMRGLRA
jgi:hypothetical protein